MIGPDLYSFRALWQHYRNCHRNKQNTFNALAFEVDAAAQGLVASCKVKVGLDAATGCAGYDATSDTFQRDVKVPKNTTGTHQVLAQILAPDGSGLVNDESVPVTIRR